MFAARFSFNVARSLPCCWSQLLHARTNNWRAMLSQRHHNHRRKVSTDPVTTFGGEINLGAEQSKPCWPATVVPPRACTKYFADHDRRPRLCRFETFGGDHPHAFADRVAKAGLRYTQFHTTSLCSPTRAALITGRNHHSVGFGVIAELSTGYPGYNAVIERNSATIGEILKENGYATSWFGKNHNTPSEQYSVAGPLTNGLPGWDSTTSTGSWAANPTSGRRGYSQHDSDFSVGWTPRLQPHNRHGGRGNQIPERVERRLARQTVLPLLRTTAVRMPPINQRLNGSRRLATCTCLTKVGTMCANRF